MTVALLFMAALLTTGCLIMTAVATTRRPMVRSAERDQRRREIRADTRAFRQSMLLGMVGHSKRPGQHIDEVRR